MQFKKRQTRKLNLDITPLVDVIFLLLIFFMISTTFFSYNEIKVKLPEAAVETKQMNTGPIEITITRENKIYIDEKIVKPTDLLTRLQQRIATMTDKTLIIRADGQVKHQVVVQVMDAAKSAGIDKLSIATILKQK
ncbi:MAG: biopolymer transporter ExbD [Deltaproteobacteria bacterium]|jgi:biopolymer transport protein ExbD|nr:biopolymer transporter ExbD [Deltaproteobacteria bacterium]